jgi:phospholipase/carboxylesterase
MTIRTGTPEEPRLAPASGTTKSIVLLLHGYGSNGADLISLAPYWRDALPNTLFVAPNAPEPVPGLPGSYQWWGLESLDRTALAAGVTRASPALDGSIDALLGAHGLSADRLAIVGFSQGTMMALNVGLRRPDPLAAIVGYSGMVADVAGVTNAIRSRPPVLLVHGDADPVVPFAAFEEARHTLRALDVPLSEHISPGLEHSIDMPGLKAAEAFLRRHLR